MTAALAAAVVATLLPAPAPAAEFEHTADALVRGASAVVSRLDSRPRHAAANVRRLGRMILAARRMLALAEPGKRTERARLELLRLGLGVRAARRSINAGSGREARRLRRRARIRLATRPTAFRRLRMRDAVSEAVSPPPAPEPPVQPPAPVPLPPYRVSGYTPQALPADEAPFNRPAVVALDDPNIPVNPDGTRRYEIDGVDHPHPTVLENYALAMLNGYRVTGEQEYLSRAIANADKLLAHAVHSRNGIYLSYTFPFDVFGDPGERLDPPWHSGMAQGRALIMFRRLFEATGDSRWRDAEESVYATTFHPRTTGWPWMAFVDGAGYLWFEEYPTANPPRVLNGHLSALIGYWSYAVATGDPEAVRIFDGAATTALHYAHVLRRPGQYSAYSVRTPVQNAFYHGVHIDLLRMAARLTGDQAFSEIAAAYASDAEPAAAGG